ncbi:hypothetical protein FB451DRAFT_1405908 [Mycena latifolia]|nr:hypothetical protein FB451DRAFT_1405908 [Mycena latifolia]
MTDPDLDPVPAYIPDDVPGYTPAPDFAAPAPPYLAGCFAGIAPPPRRRTPLQALWARLKALLTKTPPAAEAHEMATFHREL